MHFKLCFADTNIFCTFQGKILWDSYPNNNALNLLANKRESVTKICDEGLYKVNQCQLLWICWRVGRNLNNSLRLFLFIYLFELRIVAVDFDGFLLWNYIQITFYMLVGRNKYECINIHFREWRRSTLLTEVALGRWSNKHGLWKGPPRCKFLSLSSPDRHSGIMDFDVFYA